MPLTDAQIRAKLERSRRLARRARAQLIEAGRRCPACAAPVGDEVDALQVFRCAGCGIEYRAPECMPIRRARVTRVPRSERESSIEGARSFYMGTLAVMVGLAAIGKCMAVLTEDDVDERARQIVSEPSVEPPRPEPKPKPRLELEIEADSREADHLRATGWIVNRGTAASHEPEVSASCRVESTAELVLVDATMACRWLEPGRRCAWALEAEVPEDCGELDYRVGDLGVSNLDKLVLERRFADDGAPLGPGELRFDPATGILILEPGRVPSLRLCWVSLTALDAEGRVLDVAVTWSVDPREAEAGIELARPRASAELASWVLRLEGLSD